MIDSHGLVLGELAVRKHLITRKQLDEALNRQADTDFRKPLGEILIAMGAITSDKLDTLLSSQKRAIADYEELLSVSGLFGRIAVESGFITALQLSTCIRRQLQLDGEGKRVKIGHIMIREGVLSPQNFWRIIQMQGPFKCGHCSTPLENPRFEEDRILCEKCGKPALAFGAF